MTVSSPGPLSKALFAQVIFYIVPSLDLTDQESDSLTNTLYQYGAVQHPLSYTNDKIPVEEVTHLITTTSDFPDYETAVGALKAVVKPQWVAASLSKGRLASIREYDPDPRHFFSGLVVTCADLPVGDSEAINGGVLAMGGLYSSSLTKMVTHIVALNTDSEKCQMALEKGLKCKLVLPHWFNDCLTLGKRIDEAPYCLPDPEILRKRPEDRITEVGRPDLQGATSVRPGRLPTPSASPSAGRRQLTVFKNRKIMLSNDLEINNHLRGTIEDLIVNGGGSVTGSVHKADIFICQYRDTLEYRIASRAGRDVGNLPWLYHLVTHNTWTSPLRRLLHYPIARHGLPGFKDYRISLSNYYGESRVYLENVAKAAGGEFTKTMKEDNTHLITAHLVSEKCDAAKEWNINMINHLWLEESYAKWEIQSLANPRYIHFPSRTNLSEVVGKTRIDKQALERHFFPKGSDIEPTTEDGASGKPASTGDHTKVSGAVPYRALHQDRRIPKAAKSSGENNFSSSVKTPTASRISGQGKENETPPSTGSRSAKERAVAKLHDLAPDIALYEKESKRVGGVVFGGRKSSEDRVSETSRKRSASKDDETGTEADDENRGAKKAKKSKSLPISMRLLLTGYKRWIGQAKKEGEERSRLREIGILITQDPVHCTHLASPHIVRTQKFLCALAHAPIVLSTEFIDRCLAENKMLPPKDFELHDADGEVRLGCKLAEVTARAKENKRQLLQNQVISCTEMVHGGFETYKAIIEANGGKCQLYRGRAISGNPGRAGGGDGDLGEMEHSTPEHLYLISGTTSDEAKLWPRFRQAAQGMGMLPRIVRTEWMIDLALSQKMNWRDQYELTDHDAQHGE